ncbi:competence/damage-inducible protein cinA [Brevibacterium antiquum]|uniref:Competence/damage-inducible protein cinA n=1 Tax=Brevibacterium antiquum TaxID=234835 RepID=A0A2H1IBV1_9MICO|nr:competence/damage-inducible protein cinA [Brevibacterium antiquum]
MGATRLQAMIPPVLTRSEPVNDTELFSRSQHLIATCTQVGLSVAAAESLTGGRFVATLVDVPGASAVVRGGLITYATDLKASLAGVDADQLEDTGPIDEVVAAQMAAGAARECVADIGVACTGVAGPEPQDGKPVGLVYTAIAFAGKAQVSEHHFAGGRDTVRSLTVAAMVADLDDFVTQLAFGPAADAHD